MATFQDYLTETEAQRLQHIESDRADLKRMVKDLSAERERIVHRAGLRLETATRQARRAAEQAAMAESRHEHRGCV